MPAGDGAKTVWVQWSDTLGNWSAPVSDSITLDQTAPAPGTVVINGGAAVTNAVSRQVSLALTNPGGATSVRIAESVAGLASATPRAYATPITFTLAAGLDGTRTVYVQWLDAAGNPSTPASDSIVLDLRKPQGTVAINGGSAGTKSLTVTLTFPNTDTDVDAIEVSNNPNMSGATTFAVTPPFTGSKSWTLSGPLTNGTTRRSTSLPRLGRPDQHPIAGQVYSATIHQGHLVALVPRGPR